MRSRIQLRDINKERRKDSRGLEMKRDIEREELTDQGEQERDSTRSSKILTFILLYPRSSISHFTQKRPT